MTASGSNPVAYTTSSRRRRIALGMLLACVALPSSAWAEDSDAAEQTDIQSTAATAPPAGAASVQAAVAAPQGTAAPVQTTADWTTAGGTPQGTRFSALTDITPANAGTLVEEFAYPTGTKGSHQGSPLVVGKVMYVVTPFPNKLIALDLTHPGKALWTFNPQPAGYARGLTCCDIVNRGAAYANGLVVYTLLDGNVVAVNALTGTQVWRTKVAEPWNGETLNGAPIIVNGKVIFGSSGERWACADRCARLTSRRGSCSGRATAPVPTPRC